jgi:hypothetical protein
VIEIISSLGFLNMRTVKKRDYYHWTTILFLLVDSKLRSPQKQHGQLKHYKFQNAVSAISLLTRVFSLLAENELFTSNYENSNQSTWLFPVYMDCFRPGINSIRFKSLTHDKFI